MIRLRILAVLVAAGLVAACAGPTVDLVASKPLVLDSAGNTATTPSASTPTSSQPSSSQPATPDGRAESETSKSDTRAPASTLPPIIEPELLASIDIATVVNVGDAKPDAASDALLAVALVDLDRWWSEQYPILYDGAYSPLEGGIYAGYPGRSTDIPGCGTGEPTTTEELTQYGAFYCQFGDFIAYDAANNSYLTQLSDEYGVAVFGVVMAHEWGHAIQARRGVLDGFTPTIITEQQADCFAGAWVGRTYRGESDLLRLGDRDVRTALVALLSVRDPVGTDQFEPGGHGSAFDRVNAFQEGFNVGPQRCISLIDEPLPLMPNEFRPLSLDEYLGGNAAYHCSELPADAQTTCRPAYEFLADDLTHFWQGQVVDFPDLVGVPVQDLTTAPCPDRVTIDIVAALCVGNATVIYEESAVLELYREFGDFTLGYLYGLAWSEAALRLLDDPTTGEQRALRRDCLTGVWVQDITPSSTGEIGRPGDRDGDGIDDSVTTSPGDLDEAIRMAVLRGDEGVNINSVGTAFEKIDAFRNGVLNGSGACGVIAN